MNVVTVSKVFHFIQEMVDCLSANAVNLMKQLLVSIYFAFQNGPEVHQKIIQRFCDLRESVGCDILSFLNDVTGYRNVSSVFPMSSSWLGWIIILVPQESKFQSAHPLYLSFLKLWASHIALYGYEGCPVHSRNGRPFDQPFIRTAGKG